ncbi:MAG: DNA mismatch repair endonuclease MutL, partial [Thermoguttaceae bacterium]|nr:DNA mismatch repair endonuclease MutL [Thermoguttaceae bacterium]
IRTLGFRGEALASIAAVSQLTLRSRVPEADHGAMIEVHGGQAGPVVPCACPVGTIVEVRNLFFNTPVRRKFLRSVQTELGHVTEALLRIALAMPQVHFTLRHGERVLLELPAGEDQLERIARCCGRDLAEALLYVENREGLMELTGYVSHPNYSRPNNRMQYFFLNGRYIRDRSLQHALAEAYRGLLTVGRFPAGFLFLRMPAELVDVNVHPTKLEVRFQDSGRVYSQVLSALRAKFLSTDMTARMQPTAADPTGLLDPHKAAQHRAQVVAWAKGKIAQWVAGAWAGAGADFGPAPWELDDVASNRPAAEQPSLASHNQGSRVGLSEAMSEFVGSTPSSSSVGGGEAQGGRSAGLALRVGSEAPGPSGGRQPPRAASEPGLPEAGGKAVSPAYRPTAVQMHNRYLVVETEEGLLIFDQHALHESILYEELRERASRGPLATQRLLTPEPVDLTPTEAALVLEHRLLLQQVGLLIEPFGGNTVLVLSCPNLGRQVRPAELVHAVVERLAQTGRAPNQEELVDELLHTLACRAAVKAGDPLTAEEIEALLARRQLAVQSHHCPHGRPTAILLTRQELDRQFRRA